MTQKKFSRKKQLTTTDKLAKAGPQLEVRLETWLGRVRKRVQRNEEALKTTVGQLKRLPPKVKALEAEVGALQALYTRVMLLEAEVRALQSKLNIP